jgi:hypothetical protein
MKNIIVFSMLMTIAATSFSQQITPQPQLTKQDYLKKSKKQKTIGWILAGTGVTSVVLSIATLDGTEIFSSIDGDDGPINRFGALFFGGGVVTLSSIPFFISSGKNNRKAMSMSFKMQQVPQMQISKITNQSIPSLSLKVGL